MQLVATAGNPQAPVGYRGVHDVVVHKKRNSSTTSEPPTPEAVYLAADTYVRAVTMAVVGVDVADVGGQHDLIGGLVGAAAGDHVIGKNEDDLLGPLYEFIRHFVDLDVDDR